jgi:hypothetical protein
MSHHWKNCRLPSHSSRATHHSDFRSALDGGADAGGRGSTRALEFCGLRIVASHDDSPDGNLSPVAAVPVAIYVPNDPARRQYARTADGGQVHLWSSRFGYHPQHHRHISAAPKRGSSEPPRFMPFNRYYIMRT